MTHAFKFPFAAVIPSGHVFTLLSLDGLGVTINMAVNGAITPQSFDYIAPAEMIISRVNIFMEDGDGGVKITPDNFLGMGIKLANGIRVVAIDEDGGEAIDYLDGETIKSHKQFALLAGVDSVTTASGATNETVLVRWTIASAGAALRLSEGERLRFIIQDDLTSVIDIRAMVQGIEI